MNLVWMPTYSPSFSYCARRTCSSAGFRGLWKTLNTCTYQEMEPGSSEIPIRISGIWNYANSLVSKRRASRPLTLWSIISWALTWQRRAHGSQVLSGLCWYEWEGKLSRGCVTAATLTHALLSQGRRPGCLTWRAGEVNAMWLACWLLGWARPSKHSNQHR